MAGNYPKKDYFKFGNHNRGRWHKVYIAPGRSWNKFDKQDPNTGMVQTTWFKDAIVDGAPVTLAASSKLYEKIKGYADGTTLNICFGQYGYEIQVMAGTGQSIPEPVTQVAAVFGPSQQVPPQPSRPGPTDNNGPMPWEGQPATQQDMEAQAAAAPIAEPVPSDKEGTIVRTSSLYMAVDICKTLWEKKGLPETSEEMQLDVMGWARFIRNKITEGNWDTDSLKDPFLG